MSQTIVITDPTEAAKVLLELIKPELRECMKSFFENKGQEDRRITTKEAMQILHYSSEKTLKARVEAGKLHKFKDGRKVQYSYNEVINLSKAI